MSSEQRCLSPKQCQAQPALRDPLPSEHQHTLTSEQHLCLLDWVSGGRNMQTLPNENPFSMSMSSRGVLLAQTMRRYSVLNIAAP